MTWCIRFSRLHDNGLCHFVLCERTIDEFCVLSPILVIHSLVICWMKVTSFGILAIVVYKEGEWHSDFNFVSSKLPVSVCLSIVVLYDHLTFELLSIWMSDTRHAASLTQSRAWRLQT